MSDDVFVLKYYGYEAGREWENIIEETVNKKGKKKEKISFKIQYKRLPDDFYIIQNDIVTLYKGILDHNDILIQEKTYNNRRIK